MCIQRVQNNILRTIANAPWISKIDEIHEYLNVPTVQVEIDKHKKKYAYLLSIHPNVLANDFLKLYLECWKGRMCSKKADESLGSSLFINASGKNLLLNIISFYNNF